ncbi:MAG: ComEC family competence protein [Rudanella sp.]|nr:ComEC family competence protein [Rudanella sp.]
MKSAPFARFALALVAGIIGYHYCPNAHYFAIITGVVGIGCFVGGWWQQAHHQTPGFRSLGMWFGLVTLAMLMGWLTTRYHTPRTHPDNIVHLTDSLRAYVGVIDGLPEERAKTYRVELEISKASTDRAGWHPLSGRVIVYLDKTGQKKPRYGEVWIVSGEPRPIDPPLNPAEFDYKQYLGNKGIYHQQYLRPYQRQEIGYAPRNQIIRFATSMNAFADSVFTRQVGSKAESGIVNAMLLGVRDDVDPELYKAYSAAGAVHVLSVSGLHVGILFNVMVLMLGLFRKGKKTRKEKLIIGIAQLVVLWFYALVTGLSPAVLRSAGMFSVLILGSATNREANILNTLGVSSFFILLFDPYALFSAGFQLSYVAVAGIGLWHKSVYELIEVKNKFLDHVWEITAVALVAQLATFPLGVYYFHQFPTYFLLANPVVMDMVAGLLPLAMFSLAVCWVPFLRDLTGFLLQKMTWLLNQSVSQTSQLPGGLWERLWLSAFEMLILYGVILAAMYAWRARQASYGWLATGLALLLMGMLLSDELARRNQQRLAVHFLPHKTAVSLTSGGQSILLTDLDVANDPRSFDFYLKNTFGLWGIGDLTVGNTKQDSLQTVPGYRQTDAYALWVWQGKTVLLINKLRGQTRWQLPAVVDYAIIRRNAMQQWSDLDRRVVARHIIFDDSNKTPLTDRLLLEARQRGIRCYSVRQQGAYIDEL